MWDKGKIDGKLEQCFAHLLNPGIVYDYLLPIVDAYLCVPPALSRKLWGYSGRVGLKLLETVACDTIFAFFISIRRFLGEWEIWQLPVSLN